jgi:hypothetical protein
MKGNYLGLGDCRTPNCMWCKIEDVLIMFIPHLVAFAAGFGAACLIRSLS